MAKETVVRITCDHDKCAQVAETWKIVPPNSDHAVSVDLCHHHSLNLQGLVKIGSVEDLPTRRGRAATKSLVFDLGD